MAPPVAACDSCIIIINTNNNNFMIIIIIIIQRPKEVQVHSCCKIVWFFFLTKMWRMLPIGYDGIWTGNSDNRPCL